MFRFGLLLLMPTALLASNYRSYGNHQNPVGYNDDANNRDFVHNGFKPGSNIIFNFEQLRRDQPPQIEMRDESPFMHRRQQTTTPVAPIVVAEINTVPENKRFENKDQFSRFSNVPSRVNSDHYQQSTPNYNQYNPNPAHSTPMPSPPPAPKWSDFSETFNKQAFPHYGSQSFEQKTPEVPEFNHFQPPPQPSGPVEKSFEQMMPSAPRFNHFQQNPSTAPVERESLVNYDFRRNLSPPAYSPSSATPEYKASDHGSMRINAESSRQQPIIANRGTHKFGWNDLVTEPSWNHITQQVSTTLAPVTQGNNPPPLPTLTPWLDGFGK